MPKLNRRDAMIRMGLGTAGLLWGRTGAQAALPALGDLAERFRKVPRDGIYDVAAAAIRAGAGYKDLIGAAFLAGINDVRPRSVGGKLHCVMMVDSALQLSAAAPTEEAWLAALWSVDDFKNSQARDESEGGWVLPPAPEVRFTSAAEARRELVAAMDAWDTERADRAITGLLPFHNRQSLFEILWPYAARCYVDIGHKIIFCSQVEKALRRLGWQYAEPALRSLVNGLLYQSDEISGSELAVFDNARRLAPRLPVSWQKGKEDPQQSKELLRQLRGRDAQQAQALVVAAFGEGLGPRTVWDGLRLYASELLQRRPKSAARRHGPVHGVTEVSAFHHASRMTHDETTKRLMILQAAGWLPLMRRDLIRFFGDQQGPTLEALGGEAAEERSEKSMPEVGELFEELSPDLARRWIDATPDGSGPFIARLRHHLTHRAFQSHQYKYAAAIQEEALWVHPLWRSRILAPAVTYVPTAVDPETQVAQRSLHALRSAGVV